MADEFARFVERFDALHRRAKTGALAQDERTEYVDLKESFAHAMCEAHGIEVPPGQCARACFHVAALFKVQVVVDGGVQRASAAVMWRRDPSGDDVGAVRGNADAGASTG